MEIIQSLTVLRISQATNAHDQTPFKIKTLRIKLCLAHLIAVFVHCLYLSRLNNDSKLLSDAKQLLDYDIISNSSVTSATQDTDTLSLASGHTTSDIFERPKSIL